MAVFNSAKVVAALPSPLAPDTVYYLRVGVGIEIYVSDSTGSVAHAINRQWQELTQAAYDALDPPDAGTLYVIVG